MLDTPERAVFLPENQQCEVAIFSESCVNVHKAVLLQRFDYHFTVTSERSVSALERKAVLLHCLEHDRPV